MNMTKITDIDALEDKANEVRQDIIHMLLHAGSGHSAGSLGMADVFTALYFNVLNHDPKKPEWPERDRVVLSNGHIAPVLYTVMANSGYFNKKELLSLRQFGSRLQGHPERSLLPGLETTSGPLGEGLSQACGMSYGLLMQHRNRQFVYCLMGDGEINEGNIWEAAMFAGKNKLSNLTAIIDRNNIQIDGATEDVMPLEDLEMKWKAFGWHVITIDGNNISAVIDAMQMAKAVVDKPVMILAYTIPGKGVDFMEYDFTWHGKPPDKKQAKEALHQLRTLNGKINSEHQ